MAAAVFAAMLAFQELVSAFAEPAEARLAEGIERAKRATIGILQDGAGGSAGPGSPARFSLRGSGFHLRDGYIVTAQHAVDRDEAGKRIIPRHITVLTTALEELPAELTGVNAFLDIAVYRIADNGAALHLGTVAFAKDEPQAGDEVYTIGYPLGWGPAVGFGRIGNPNTFLPTVESRLYQIDLSACSGNSGGGLFNREGEVVGVVHAIIQTETTQADRRCSRFAFSVPGPLVQRIVSALIQGAEPRFSRLGISMKPVKTGTRWQLAVAEATGPALEAGIQKGDLLLAIENVEITDAAQLKNYLIERTEPGQRISVKVLRDRQEKLFTVTLGGM
jgi:serine protease Do